MTPTRVHHLNFLVRDLDEAMNRFEQLLDVEPFSLVEHAPRGANVARTRVGETWLVLVCPYDDESVPGRILAKSGEGIFLVSFGVDDLVAQIEALEHGGIDLDDEAPRSGILDWKVVDVGEIHGAIVQLTQDDQ